MLLEKKFKRTISSEEELRSLIGTPSELVQKKVIHFIDTNCGEFISKSPFLALATSNHLGLCDVSPRGDGPGFVKVLDEKHLIIPERPGNKRVDSLTNILSNPRVGLLFFIPGLGETLRVNGYATLIQDDEILEQMSVKGKMPLIGIAIEVEECFIHCAKAFIRSGLWNPDSWLEKNDLPSAAKILTEHAKMPEYTSDAMEELLKEGYLKRLY